MSTDLTFKNVVTTPTTILDPSGNPVQGVVVHFEFEPNHVGELRVSLKDVEANLVQAKIIDYIKAVRRLEGESF